MRPKRKKIYAYFIPTTREARVVATWSECEKATKGVQGARFQGFFSEADAEAWLKDGAQYVSKPKPQLEKGVYFDAGTGRGDGVEISVTDETGKDLLHEAVTASELNQWGKILLGHSRTNNFGELLACKYALHIALRGGLKKVFGDSALVVNHWSKGAVREKLVDPETVSLVRETSRIRKEFEAEGGGVFLVDGDFNPADLGFH